MARETFGGRAALFAAATIAVAMPLTYYSKIVNLDVPYVFWLCVALLFYLRIYRTGRARDFYLFTVSGVAAICTKDQAYGFFVFPAAVMIRAIDRVRFTIRPSPERAGLRRAGPHDRAHRGWPWRSATTCP